MQDVRACVCVMADKKVAGSVGVSPEDAANPLYFPPEGLHKRAAPKLVDEIEADEEPPEEVVAPNDASGPLVWWMSAASGASIILRVCMLLSVSVLLIMGVIGLTDTILFSVLIALFVPVGIVVGVLGLMGAVLWAQRWALLYSGTLSATAFNSFLGVIGLLIAAIYLAFAETLVATPGSTLEADAAYADHRAMIFQLVAMGLFITGIMCVMLDFGIAYLSAGLRYLIDSDSE